MLTMGTIRILYCHFVFDSPSPCTKALCFKCSNNGLKESILIPNTTIRERADFGNCLIDSIAYLFLEFEGEVKVIAIFAAPKDPGVTLWPRTILTEST